MRKNWFSDMVVRAFNSSAVNCTFIFFATNHSTILRVKLRQPLDSERLLHILAVRGPFGACAADPHASELNLVAFDGPGEHSFHLIAAVVIRRCDRELYLVAENGALLE